jgi:hypothetical protein
MKNKIKLTDLYKSLKDKSLHEQDIETWNSPSGELHGIDHDKQDISGVETLQVKLGGDEKTELKIYNQTNSTGDIDLSNVTLEFKGEKYEGLNFEFSEVLEDHENEGKDALFVAESDDKTFEVEVNIEADYDQSGRIQDVEWRSLETFPKEAQQGIAEGTCGYGEDGKLGDEPAGPHLFMLEDEENMYELSDEEKDQLTDITNEFIRKLTDVRGGNYSDDRLLAALQFIQLVIQDAEPMLYSDEEELDERKNVMKDKPPEGLCKDDDDCGSGDCCYSISTSDVGYCYSCDGPFPEKPKVDDKLGERKKAADRSECGSDQDCAGYTWADHCCDSNEKCVPCSDVDIEKPSKFKLEESVRKRLQKLAGFKK